MVGHLAVSLIPLCLPLACFLGSYFTSKKMSEDSEFLAFRSLRSTLLDMLTPIIFWTSLISLTFFSFNYSYVAYSKSSFKKIFFSLSSMNFISDIKPGVFFTGIPNTLFFADEVDSQTSLLKKIFIHFQENEVKSKVVHAKSGKFIRDRNSEQIFLKLNSGNIINKDMKINKGDKDELFEKIIFKEYSFPVNIKQLTSKKVVSNSLKSLWTKIYVNKVHPKEAKSENFLKNIIDFWNRIFSPLHCFIFSILGFLMGIHNPRFGNDFGGGKSILFVIGYYVIYFSLISFGLKLYIPIWFAVVFPIIFYSMITIIIWRKKSYF